jgi:Di-haem oxidoreductase, putative peroxidase
MNGRFRCSGRVAYWVLLLLCHPVAQTAVYPSNATSCDQCHSVPSKFGSSLLTVERAGRWENGKYIPAVEGGIFHRHGDPAKSTQLEKGVVGERVSINLLGDGFIEAIADEDLRKNAAEQHTSKTGIRGILVEAPVLESGLDRPKIQVGRFGWKGQHSSLMSACADSLRNELGIRNQLYPDEYSNHTATSAPTPFDVPDTKSEKTELERLVDEVRRTAPPCPAPT